MKYLISYCFTLMFICCIIAQSNQFPHLNQNFQQPQIINNNTAFNNLKKHIQKLPGNAILNLQQLPSDNFVLKLAEPKLTYKGNSIGFNVYQATPDQMFVIQPDSTTVFNMPVAFANEKEAMQIPNGSSLQP